MLTLRFLNVADGDAALVEFDTGQRLFRLLVDAGRAEPEPFPGSSRASAAEHLRRLGIRRLDAVVITHLHQDHFGGLEALARKIPIGDLYAGFFPPALSPAARLPEGSPKTVRGLWECLADWNRILELLRRKGTRLQYICHDQMLPCPPGLSARVIVPDAGLARRRNRIWDELLTGKDPDMDQLVWSSKQRNPGSLRLELTFASRRVILAGDCYGSCWQNPPPASCDLLKVPHHGDAKALTQPLVDALRPRYAVISCEAAYNPRKDRPSPEVVRMLLETGCRVYFTDYYPPPGGSENRLPSVDFLIGDDGVIHPPAPWNPT